MNRKEYLLVCLAEECNEVAHRIGKALRFGLKEVQPGQDLDNAERIALEIGDLMGVLKVISDDDNLLGINMNAEEFDAAVDAKCAKIQKYYDYAVKIGAVKQLQEAPPEVEDVMEVMVLMRKMISPEGNVTMDGANLQRVNRILYPQSTHNFDAAAGKEAGTS